MIKHYYPGKLIVFEGVDGAGKTTCLSKLTKQSSYTYGKALGSKTLLGKIAHRFPSTLLFSLEMLGLSWLNIIPQLKQQKIILQDRYFFSIASHYPQTDKKINQLMLKMFEKLIIKPDLVIYLTVDSNKRIQRLKLAPPNPFHATLIKHPHLIQKREEKYQSILHKHHAITLDNSKQTISETVNQINIIIKNL